jgi:hypothetical protein
MGPGGFSSLPVQLRFRVALEIPPTHVQDKELLAALGESSKSIDDKKCVKFTSQESAAE